MPKVIQDIECPECGAEFTIDFGDSTPHQIVFCGACGEILADPDHPEQGWDDDDDEGVGFDVDDEDDE